MKNKTYKVTYFLHEKNYIIHRLKEKMQLED